MVHLTGSNFQLGMFLPELRLPFERALENAAAMGVHALWLDRLDAQSRPIAEMTPAEIDAMTKLVDHYGLTIVLLNAATPFKEIHLTDLSLATLRDDPLFRRDFAALVRSLQIARDLGISTVGTFTFAWPGEYSAGKPTWPMRWLTHGGYIADVDMEKLVMAFSLVMEEAERYGIDVALSMMPWNYTNTTGNFRRLAERLDAKRLKVMWGPADNLNSGEEAVETTGILNVKPFLRGLHIKDLRVIDGLRLKFEYCPFGEGDVNYERILRQLWQEDRELLLSVSTHFLPPSGSPLEAMQTNLANIRALLAKIEESEVEKVKAK
jgi:sugar phosphate isomerase/epimerase